MRWLGRMLVLGGLSSLGACTEAPVTEEVGSSNDGIINGSLDTTHQAVVAWIAGGGKCTATIVDVVGSQGYALTAAHCVGGSMGNILQGNNHNNPTATYPVAEVAVHPDYASSSAWDYAMLRFTGANGSTPVIAPLTKALDNVQTGTQLDIIGYGQTESGPTSQRRHVVKPVFDDSDVLFVYDQATSGACFGDSGGPHLHTTGNTEYVAGVTFAGQNMQCSGFAIGGRASAITSTFVEPFINGTPFLPQTCDECTAGTTAVSDGSCVDEVNACSNNPACGDWVNCVNGCSGLPCMVQCDQTHASGKAAYDNIVGCLCGTCNTECAGDALCEEPPACYLEVTNDSCQSCFESNCCAEAAACAGDQDCLDCGSLTPSSDCPMVSTWADFVTCTQQSCGDVCTFTLGGGGMGGGGGTGGAGGSGGAGGAGVGGAGVGGAGVGGAVGTGGTPGPSGAGGSGNNDVDGGDGTVVESGGCAQGGAGSGSSRGWALIGLALMAAGMRRRRHQAVAAA